MNRIFFFLTFGVIIGCGALVPSQRVQQGAIQGAVRPIVKPIIEDVERAYHVEVDYKFKIVERQLKDLERRYSVLYEICLKKLAKDGRFSQMEGWQKWEEMENRRRKAWKK